MKSCIKCIDHKRSWQTYSIQTNDGEFWFNVTKANKLVADGRIPVAVAPNVLDQMLLVNQLEEQHVEHVDISKPGIIAFDERNDGGFFFIDGTHRAERCRRLNFPFRVYTIASHETPRIRIASPIQAGAITTEELRALLGPDADSVLDKLG